MNGLPASVGVSPLSNGVPPRPEIVTPSKIDAHTLVVESIIRWWLNPIRWWLNRIVRKELYTIKGNVPVIACGIRINFRVMNYIALNAALHAGGG